MDNVAISVVGLVSHGVDVAVDVDVAIGVAVADCR